MKKILLVSGCSNTEKDLDLKADKREMDADRNLITYKLDVMMEDIAEIKQILKEK